MPDLDRKMLDARSLLSQIFFIITRKRSLRMLCFHKHLSFCPRGCVSQYALGVRRCVSNLALGWEVSAQGEVSTQKMSVQGSVCPEGVSAQRGVSTQRRDVCTHLPWDQRQTLPGTRGRHPLDQSRKWVVRILLQCILVFITFWVKFDQIIDCLPFGVMDWIKGSANISWQPTLAHFTDREVVSRFIQSG